ncbi:hypothetical protein BWQ96_09660 [Gracilariopsis chorda]|uniref:Uncharacterized protein n=1 Tax=Gracilariopsis chorda TaxID=448386 RepID=A0A2V3IEW4_9FLOR|nr:hypothetical protein BWQ96_09660 [Gracilariopsis chorda]|eukprot:PXF40629.1 hypothetical protein BWQ96_09660 [Gracilariopsis chorda]
MTLSPRRNCSRTAKENKVKTGKLPALAMLLSVLNEDPDDDDLKQAMRSLVVESRVDDNDDEEDPDTVVEREQEVSRQQGSQEVVENRGLNNIFTTVMRPFETVVFGRLMKRGQRVGHVMGSVLGKLMKATEDRRKVCVMANSLGAQVLCGLLNRPHQLPYKIHTIFFVQGAIAKDWFHPGAKYGYVHEVVAGPVLCTYSQRDLLLRNIFGWFHGIAIGFDGTPIGQMIRMKHLHEVADDPYGFGCEAWNNVDGTE